MLESNVIPKEEPDIRVGIVLPEDRFRIFQFEVPKSSTYTLENSAGNKVARFTNKKIEIQLRDNQIIALVDNREIGAARTFTIFPDGDAPIAPKSGLLLRNVIAGRVFHWKKEIDVFVPGALTIQAHEGALIVTNTLRFEEYVMCVATSEMSAACPEALIQAQTVAARSWMLANVEQKHRALGMDVCNDDCCQRYQGSTFLTQHAIDGVLKTRGEVLIFDGKICDARYSKSCGGMMESFNAVWGGEDAPYLQVKPDIEPAKAAAARTDLSDEQNFRAWLANPPEAFCSPKVVPENNLIKYLGGVDVDGEYFRWRLQITEPEVRAAVNKKTGIRAHKILNLDPIERAGSGRLTQLRIVYKDESGLTKEHFLQSEYAIRDALHKGFLFSSAIAIDELPASQDEDEKRFKIEGCGWGHGVGLCQIGALGMALEGRETKEILLHYYPGAQLKKIY